MALKLVKNATNPVFNELFSTEMFHSQPCRFAHIQTDIQTVITDIFRQINLIFLIFLWHWSWSIIPKYMCTGWNLNSKWPTEMLSHLNSWFYCLLFSSLNSHYFNWQSEGRDFQKIITLVCAFPSGMHSLRWLFL